MAAEDAGAEPAGIESAAPGSGRGVGRVTKIVFGLSLVIFIWYVQADGFTPYTSQRPHALADVLRAVAARLSS